MRIFIGMTGASGSLYAEHCVKAFLPVVDRLYFCATETGKKVALHELEKPSLVRNILSNKKPDEKIHYLDEKDFFAPVASGSSAPHAVIVVPCSMGSLGRMASGSSTNLIERTVDVALKQRLPCLIVPRETPMTLIHLRNMITLTEAGAIIVPAMPAFYQKPATLEDLGMFMAGRLFELLGMQHTLYPPWNPSKI